MNKWVNPIKATQKFTADAAATAFKSIDKPMDPAKVVKNPPRWFKPVTYSELRKTTSKDKDYFKK